MLKRRRLERQRLAAVAADAAATAAAVAAAKESALASAGGMGAQGTLAGVKVDPTQVMQDSQASRASAVPLSQPRAKKRCPYCGSPNLSTYNQEERVQIVCDDCGSNVYVDSQLTVEEDFTAIVRVRGNAIQRRAQKAKTAAELPTFDLVLPSSVTWCPEKIVLKKASIPGKVVVVALHEIIEEQAKFLRISLRVKVPRPPQASCAHF